MVSEAQRPVEEPEGASGGQDTGEDCLTPHAGSEGACSYTECDDDE